MWPAIAAIAGSLIGAAATRSANRDNRLMQEKFASEGIQRRVADAKAAGVHPLFALGASTPSFSPSAQPIFESQDVSRALMQFTPEERQMRQASLEAVKAAAAKDYALAAAADAEAARARQEANYTAPVAQAFPVTAYGSADTGPEVSVDGGPFQNVRMASSFVQGKPHPYLTNADGAATPGFRRYGVPGAGEVILPDASNMAESLEGLESIVTQAAVIYANVQHYGRDVFGLRKALSYIGSHIKSAVASNAFREAASQAVKGALGVNK